MAIQIIGMPLGCGAGVPGAEYGPGKLRELGLEQAIRWMGFEIYDTGDIETSENGRIKACAFDNRLKHIDVVADANTRLAYRVYESISGGNFPLILGGDHSLGLGSIAGLSKQIKRLGVIWIDAHGDLNTESTTPSGNIHGMSLAASMGLGAERLVNLFDHRKKIEDKNIVLIGTRALDDGEINLLNNSKIKTYNMDVIRKIGIKSVAKRALSYLRGRVDGIHVSFDIDFLDAELVPGTGTPVSGGGSIEEAKILLGAIARSGMMVSMDFAELDPLIDKGDATANVCVDLLSHVFACIKTISKGAAMSG